MKNRTSRRILLLYLVVYLGIYIKGSLNQLLSHDMWYFWCAELTVWLLIPLAAFIFGTQAELFSKGDLGYHTVCFDTDKEGQFLMVCVYLTPALWLLSRYSTELSFSLFPLNAPPGFSYRNVVLEAGGWRIIVLLYFSLTAGFVEETLRSLARLLFDNSTKDMISYVVFSSVVFSLSHLHHGLYSVVATFIFGLIMACLFLLLRNVWSLVISHAIIDWMWLS